MILVVEDDQDILTFLDEVLSDEGYPTERCHDGKRALALVRELQPKLVILDLWLGTTETGWTILEQLRADPATRAVPVIVYSADARALADHAPLFAAECSAVLRKPFRLEQLLAAVEDAIGPASHHTQQVA